LIKFVPLHEQLNREMSEKLNESDDEEDVDGGSGEVVNKEDDYDPYFIDENLFKELDETLSEEEKKVKNKLFNYNYN
jgi:hypothetical protein